MELIDSHVHLLHPERLSYEWCEGVPGLRRAFWMDDYRAAVGSGGVKAMVFMEADVPAEQQAAETDFFSRLAGELRAAPKLAAIVAGAWPESDGFAGQVEALARNPRVRGIRRVLHTMPAELCTTARFAESLRLLPKHELAFDLCVRPPLIPAVSELAARCPETKFVLDHCGVPNVAGRELDPWRGMIRQLAERPNVVCKFSGLASLCDPKLPLTPQVRPYFQHCVECFGPERVMWGSDWPLTDLKFSLSGWIQTSIDLLGELGEADRLQIAAGTATRVYRL